MENPITVSFGKLVAQMLEEEDKKTKQLQVYRLGDRWGKRERERVTVPIEQ